MPLPEQLDGHHSRFLHRRSMVMLAILLCVAGSVPVLADESGLAPHEALAQLHVADGLRVELFASEPLVQQPVTMSIDRRGRVWVIQYLQYPEPAGLQKVRGDRYDRIQYDSIPEPPPKGPRGADRVTILKDSDGDGQADQAHDFVSGLNLASGLALGHGGVWILQSPYLLFYPDRNGDDIPDEDPQVRLVGFGLDDAHSVANSLQWGPDGWLYGVHGSTVNANVRGTKFQQGIWRYHPPTDRFELFAEGGGNTYGLDFDPRGQAIAGTNWGVPGLHQRQGTYHVKNFGKHGALQNPYAFGYFQHMSHEGTAIGKLSVGGIFYRAELWPERFRGQLVTANPLNHALYAIGLRQQGSTFSTQFCEPVLWSDDPWFQPVDIAMAPDGSLLVADWYDGNINYQITYRNRDNFDPQRGRIYRVTAANAGPPSPLDLEQWTDEQLLAALQGANVWRARQARQLLAERPSAWAMDELWDRIGDAPHDVVALEALWTLYTMGGLTEQRAAQCLESPHANVRAWTIRLLGDDPPLAARYRSKFIALARSDLDIEVQAQLACTARRLESQTCLNIVSELWRHDALAADPHLPLLLWWGIDSCVDDARQSLFEKLVDPRVWQRPLFAETILPRLARRFAAEGEKKGYGDAARLLTLAPRAEDIERVVVGMEEQMRGLSTPSLPAELREPLARLWERGEQPASLIAFALRMGSDRAWELAEQRIAAVQGPSEERIKLLVAMAETGRAEAIPTLLDAAQHGGLESVRAAAVRAVTRFDSVSVATTLLEGYGQYSPSLRQEVRRALCRRASWGKALVAAVMQGAIASSDVTYEELRQLLQHQDPKLKAQVEKQWGSIRLATPQEKRQQIAALQKTLAAAKGDPQRGQPLFAEHCGKCHRLHGSGNRVGPELTPYPRHDLAYLILHTVDPGAVIRPEYQVVTANMSDGRILTGLIAETTPQTITLLDAQNQRTVLARQQIDELLDLPQSLMPENLFQDVSSDAIRDLFAYLQSKDPPPPTTASETGNAGQ